MEKELDFNEEQDKCFSSAKTSFALAIRPPRSASMIFNSKFLVEPNANSEFAFYCRYDDLVAKVIPDFIKNTVTPMSDEEKTVIFKLSVSYLQCMQSFCLLKSKGGIQVKKILPGMELDEVVEHEQRDLDSTVALHNELELENAALRSNTLTRVNKTNNVLNSLKNGFNEFYSLLANHGYNSKR